MNKYDTESKNNINTLVKHINPKKINVVKPILKWVG